MAGDVLMQEREQLQSLLAQYDNDAKELPYLYLEDADGWGQAFWEWCEEWAGSVWDWLRAWVGPLPRTDMPYIDWVFVFRIAFWIGVIVLVLGLTWVLAARYLRQTRSSEQHQWLPTGLEGEEERLRQSLRAAVQDENWGLATRLRWRLFLSRMQVPPHLTPHEFFREPHYRTHWQQQQGIPIGDQYRVMFTGMSGSRQWFEHYHGGLSNLEERRRHA
ncbi:MAG: hypothetical protein OEU26_26930 [Candidatus Tectomicrobia bacterium]|nr:hypothetical protein [Candidatus Tectomicrobia bacterium]